MNKFELLKDVKFQNGFKIRYPYHVENDDQNPEKILKIKDEIPSWYLSQWFSNDSLANGIINLSKDSLIISDKVKKVVVNNQKIYLEINGGLEYRKNRAESDAWPHLLLEQIYDNNSLINKISNYKEIIMKLNFDYTKFVDHMGSTLNRNLHTAQFQWFLNIANKNKNSNGYGDFFWFGLGFLDTPREDFPNEFMAADSGKDDASNKFIYIVDSRKYLNKKIELNDNVNIDFEVLSYIKSGFEEAKKRGFLKNTEFEDLELNSTNIGFEIPGTFDIGLLINKINLEGIK